MLVLIIACLFLAGQHIVRASRGGAPEPPVACSFVCGEPEAPKDDMALKPGLAQSPKGAQTCSANVGGDISESCESSGNAWDASSEIIHDRILSKHIEMTVERMPGEPWGFVWNDAMARARQQLILDTLSAGSASSRWNTRQHELGLETLQEGDVLLCANAARGRDAMQRELSAQNTVRMQLEFLRPMSTTIHDEPQTFAVPSANKLQVSQNKSRLEVLTSEDESHEDSNVPSDPGRLCPKSPEAGLALGSPCRSPLWSPLASPIRQCIAEEEDGYLTESEEVSDLIGATAMITGLVKSPEFNGCSCRIEAFDPQVRRYVVRVAGQPDVVTAKLRLDNLIVQSPGLPTHAVMPGINADNPSWLAPWPPGMTGPSPEWLSTHGPLQQMREFHMGGMPPDAQAVWPDALHRQPDSTSQPTPDLCFAYGAHAPGSQQLGFPGAHWPHDSQHLQMQQAEVLGIHWAQETHLASQHTGAVCDLQNLQSQQTGLPAAHWVQEMQPLQTHQAEVPEGQWTQEIQHLQAWPAEIPEGRWAQQAQHGEMTSGGWGLEMHYSGQAMRQTEAPGIQCASEAQHAFALQAEVPGDKQPQDLRNPTHAGSQFAQDAQFVRALQDGGQGGQLAQSALQHPQTEAPCEQPLPPNLLPRVVPPRIQATDLPQVREFSHSQDAPGFQGRLMQQKLKTQQLPPLPPPPLPAHTQVEQAVPASEGQRLLQMLRGGPEPQKPNQPPQGQQILQLIQDPKFQQQTQLAPRLEVKHTHGAPREKMDSTQSISQGKLLLRMLRDPQLKECKETSLRAPRSREASLRRSGGLQELGVQEAPKNHEVMQECERQVLRIELSKSLEQPLQMENTLQAPLASAAPKVVVQALSLIHI